MYGADRGFDDRKVFGQVLGLGEGFVVRVYRDRRLGEGDSLREVASSLPLRWQGQMEMRVGGRYRGVELGVGWREVGVEGRRPYLVVSRIPALGRRVEVQEGVRLVFLRPYSPELQPAERVWPLVNEAVASRYFHNLEEMMEVVAERYRVLENAPETLRRHTLFHWWPRTKALA